MSKNIFDDLTFFWILNTFFFIFLLCRTIALINHIDTSKSRKKKIKKSLPSYMVLTQMKDEQYMSKLFFTLLSWIIFFIVLASLPRLNKIKRKIFNPYEILDVKEVDDLEIIRCAYRKASLKWHPDKSFEKNSKKRFIAVNKAYKILTDENKRNLLKIYKDPNYSEDQYSKIGLPSLINCRDNKKNISLLVMSYFSLMLFVCLVIRSWWNWTYQFHKSGLLTKTNKHFSKKIRPSLDVKNCIKIFITNNEFDKMFHLINKLTMFEEYQINTLKANIVGVWFRKSIKDYPDYAVILFYAYLHLSRNDLPSCLKPLMKCFLQMAPKLLDVMIQCSLKRSFIQTAMNILELKQHLIQKQKFGEKDIVQLPYYEERMMKVLRKYKVKSLKNFLNLGRTELTNVLIYLFRKNIFRSKIEIINFKEGISMFPKIKIYYSTKSSNRKKIYLHDMISFRIKVVRICKTINLMKQVKSQLEELPTVHTFFPSKFHEKWIFLIEQENIEFIKTEALPLFISTCSLDFNLFAHNLGVNKIIISMMCDSYIGLDVHKLIKYIISSKTKKQNMPQRNVKHCFSSKTKAKDVYRYNFENKICIEAIIVVLSLYIIYLMM